MSKRAQELFKKTKQACGELQGLRGSLVCIDKCQAKGIAAKFEGVACSAKNHPDAKLFKPDSKVWLVDFSTSQEEMGE